MASSTKEKLARAEKTEASALAQLELAAVRYAETQLDEIRNDLTNAARRWTNAMHQSSRLRKRLAEETDR